MSYKTCLIKAAVKLTPKTLIIWVANFKLKGIAELLDLDIDLDTRKIYVQTQLFGETDTIDIWLEDFAIISDGQSHQFILQQARSNRSWLSNILAHITGKPWQIPNIPQLAAHIALIAELLKAVSPKS